MLIESCSKQPWLAGSVGLKYVIVQETSLLKNKPVVYYPEPQSLLDVQTVESSERKTEPTHNGAQCGVIPKCEDTSEGWLR